MVKIRKDNNCITQEKKRIHVACAVLIRDGKIFATQRGEGRSLSGFWEFPGGKTEPGESAPQALVRELQEELLLDIKVDDFLVRSEYEYDFGTVVLDAYLCRIDSAAEPVLTEHQNMCWLAREDLFKLQWTAADLPVIEQIIALWQEGRISLS